MARVFISYGHNLFETIVTELAVFLVENGNHIVFKDNATENTIKEYSLRSSNTKGHLVGIPPAANYDTVLDEEIQNCDFLIAVLSRHSTRPNGVCLDEIARAREFSKKIVPLKTENVQSPFLICRVQWIELIIEVRDGKMVFTDDWDKKRKEVFARILKIINKGEPMPITGLPVIEQKLTGEPFDFSALLIEKNKHFVGRRELLNIIGEWVEDKEEDKENRFAKVLMIFGDPGSGKTALCARMPYITHICSYDKEASIDTHKIIGNLAFQLSAMFSPYGKLLSIDCKLDNISNLDLPSLIEWLFVEVLNQIESPEKPVALVIDGIDEIEHEKRVSLLDAIFKYRKGFPSWLRIIMTGRRENSITSRCYKNNSIIMNLDMGKLNEKDCKEYLRTRLKELDIQFTETDICNVVSDSSANFLFLYYLIEDLRLTGTTVLDASVVPNSIGEFYMRSFNRFFADRRDYYNSDVRPVLELICVAKSEMNVDDIAAILNTPVQVVNDVISSTGSIVVKSSNGTVFFYHRTIREWLTNHTESGEYCIVKTDGENRIIAYISNFYKKNNSLPDSEENSYICKFGTVHIVENKKTTEFENLFRSFNPAVLNNMFYSFKYISDSHAAGFLQKLKLKMRNQLAFSLCFENIIDSYNDNNMFQPAIDLCEKLEVDSDDAFVTELYCAFSIAKGKLGKAEESAEYAERAVSSAKKNYDEQNIYTQLCEAKAYQVHGVVFHKAGDCDKAEQEFLKAEERLNEILKVTDEIENWWKKVLKIHVYNWLVYIYGALGTINIDENVDLANEYFEKELVSVNRLANLMNTHRVQYKKTIAYNHLAECELVYVKYKEAEEHANESVMRTEKLYKECPSLRIRRGLAIAYAFRASARKKLGRINGYVSDAKKGLEHITGLAEEFPGERARRDLALANKRMGEALAADAESVEAEKSEGQKEDSVRYFNEAIEILKDLTGAAENEGNIRSVLFAKEDSFRNWFILSDTYLILGLTYAKWGDKKAEAFIQLEEARKILEVLEKERPSVLFRRNLADIYLYEGWIYLDKGEREKAISFFKKVNDFKLCADSVKKPVFYYSLMFRTYFALGEAYHRCGQNGFSDQYFIDAVSLLNRYFENRLTDSDREALLYLFKNRGMNKPNRTRSELERILSGMKDDYGQLIIDKIIEFIIVTIY